VRWHIRAQNASDIAALTAISADANVNNQQTMALYSATVAEYRLRSIVNSMVNAANSVGGCDPSNDDTGTDCDNAYDQEPEAYDKALGVYIAAVHYAEGLRTAPAPVALTLPNGVGGTPMPLPNAPAYSAAPAAYSLVASNRYCWDTGAGANPVFDCSFAYTANPDFSQTGLGSNEYVDIVACRKVSQVAPGIFKGLSSFTAQGRSAATLRPITESFNPGTTSDPDAAPSPGATQPPFQKIESCPPNISGLAGAEPCDLSQGWMATTPYVVDFSGLTVQATFYVPTLTAPVGGITTTPACKQG